MYKKKILGGNYNTLKSIAIVRHRVLHLKDYKVWKYKPFKQDCQSMIKYLNEPDKKPFLSRYKVPQKIIAGTVVLAGLKGKRGVKKHSFWQNIRTVWNDTTVHDWYKDILFYLGGMLAVLYGLFTMLSKKLISIKDWDTGSYILFAIGLVTFLYYLPKIMRFIYGLAQALVSFGKKSLYSDWYKMMFLFLGGIFMIYAWLQYKGSSPRKRQHIVHTTIKQQHQKPIQKTHKVQCRTAYVAVDTLHVREKPKSNSRIIDKVYKNHKLCIIKELPQWVYVQNRGWVYREHVSNTRVKTKRKNISLGDDLY